MPNRIVIEYDGTRVEIDRPMTEAAARVWLFDQALRLTRRQPNRDALPVDPTSPRTRRRRPA
jgi:hypothetical protein